MKKTCLLILTSFILNSGLKAQTPCSNGRYANDVFTNVTVTSGITYGSNKTVNGSTQTLTLDFYEPTGDTSSSRPLIIWAHGGSFIGGTSKDGPLVTLCQAFAKKGYACASINYRLGIFPFDSLGAVRAVVRAIHDMKASVRFFYKDKQTINKYKIDTNNIIAAGGSAGAITALHMAYIHKSCELNKILSQTAVDALGGFDGISGNPCYSSKVKAVVNLCGALAMYGWLTAGDVPVCSMHGTKDNTVKYSRGLVNPGIPLIYLDGSRMIHEQALAVGVKSSFYTHYNAPHAPFNGTSTTQLAFMDTTINFVRDFLIDILGCTDPILQPANAPFGTATLYPFTPCSTHIPSGNCVIGIKNVYGKLLHEAYPNPSDGDVKIVFSNNNATHLVQLNDVSGRLIVSETTGQSTYILRKNNLTPGVYFLRVSNNEREVSMQKIAFY